MDAWHSARAEVASRAILPASEKRGAGEATDVKGHRGTDGQRRSDLAAFRRRLRMTRVDHIVLGAALLLVPAAATAQPADPLACYHVRLRAPKTKYEITLANGAGSVRCTVKAQPKVACLATAEIAASPTPPGGGSPADAGSFLCYQLRCPKPLPPDTTLTDEFGGYALSVHGAQWYCAPAEATSETPGSSTTSIPAATAPSPDAW